MKQLLRKRTSKPLRRNCMLMLLAGVLSLTMRPAAVYAQSTSKEYEIKAAFVLNFIQYIEWPATAFSNSETPIAVGVLGDDSFGSMLEKVFQDESVQGHKLAVKRSREIGDLKTCHLIFVSKSAADHVAEILKSLSDTNVVTIGEIDGFAQRGGIINFYFDANKLRFEINSGAAQRKGLKINSQLLKRAKIVGSDEEKR